MTAVLSVALLLLHAPPQPQPVDVALIVDVSHSMTFGVIKRDRALVREAAEALAAAASPGDTARLGTFGDEIAIESTPLRDAGAIRAAGEKAADRIGGRSPVWDAVVAAAAAFEGAGTRRGIVVITDGRSTGNRIGFKEALAQVQRTGIPVFVISLDKSDRPIPDPGARLEELASATGGSCLFVERRALPGAIRRAVSTLRGRP